MANTREDEPLTQAGLVAALAALPAGGGTIYLGEGTLALTSPVSITKDVKIVGAGMGSTVITMTGAFAAFTIGDVFATFADFTVEGDAGATEQILFQATATSTKRCAIERVLVGTDESTFLLGVRILFDFDGFNRHVSFDDCIFGINFGAAASTTAFFLKDATTSSDIWINDTIALSSAQISGSPQIRATNWVNLANDAAQTILIGGASLISSSLITGNGGVTIGSTSYFTGVEVISIGAINISSNCVFTGCNVNGATVVATGAGVTISDGFLSIFSSTSFNFHSITGNRHQTAGTTLAITLASSSSCIVADNEACQVTETGTSDNNTYTTILSASTLLGASSVITDAQKFAFVSPGPLTTTDNALFARLPVQVSTPVRLLSVEVETAPTGASLLVAFRKGTRATGVLAAAFATVTVTAGSFTGSTTVAGVVVAPTEFLVVEITQVGSTIAGSNMTAVARA